MHRAAGPRRWTRFRLRTLFVLIAVAALGLAVPQWIAAWKARQVEPIRQAVARHHFKRDPAVVRQSDEVFLRRDIFGDEELLTVSSVGPIGFSRAEAQGSWGITYGMGFSETGMRYELVRKEGRWWVTDATETVIACGGRGSYAPEVWSRVSELTDLLESEDEAIRRKACTTLAGLALGARHLAQPPPELPQVLAGLAEAEKDPDPQVRRTASHGLTAAPYR